MTETDEFTKPKSGQVIGKFDELGQAFKVSFDIMIKSVEEGYSNILFATSADAETLAGATFNDLLKIKGTIPKDSPYPEINRHPAMWIMPGNTSDEKAGLMICGEYIRNKWTPFWSAVNPINGPLERCWSHENVESWKELSVGEWSVFWSLMVFLNSFLFRYTVEFHQWVWDYVEYEYGWGYYEHTYDFGSVTKITITGRDVNFSYRNTVGGDLNVFQRHKNVKVYGAIPSNTFKPANVKIDSFRFTKERNDNYVNYLGKK